MKEPSMELLQHVNKKGIISLISVLILGGAAAAVTIALLFVSTENFTRSEDYSDSIQAGLLAETCVEFAINNLKSDPLYTGSETLTFGEHSCDILLVTSTVIETTIQTRATYGESTRRFEVILDSIIPTTNIIQYEEVVSF